MIHSLSPVPTPPTPISPKSISITPLSSSLGFQRIQPSHSKSGGDVSDDNKLIFHRRILSLGFTGALVGLNLSGSANAARRPPQPPPGEKKDPNVSGVQAKVLASKKRKEAMKASMEKLREKGKTIVNDAVKLEEQQQQPPVQTQSAD